MQLSIQWPVTVPTLIARQNIIEGFAKSRRVHFEPHVITWECLGLHPECHRQSSAHLVDRLANRLSAKFHADICCTAFQDRHIGPIL